ncbi:bifunctional DNA primase/polymerase [Streptomyces virginiae]|uniref:bifunctional DNA primase/polymerase n=1 Tax=Streptomyces virginiae TaxID=1961 RepID=UPI0036E1D108
MALRGRQVQLQRRWLTFSAGRLGWKVDTRAWGGYGVAAGSTVGTGSYEIIHDGPPAPPWEERPRPGDEPRGTLGSEQRREREEPTCRRPVHAEPTWVLRRHCAGGSKRARSLTRCRLRLISSASTGSRATRSAAR